jgi:hypothetical protein
VRRRRGFRGIIQVPFEVAVSSALSSVAGSRLIFDCRRLARRDKGGESLFYIRFKSANLQPFMESILTRSCEFIGFEERAFRAIRCFAITTIEVCFAVLGTMKNNGKPLLFSIDPRVLCRGQMLVLMHMECMRINDRSVLIAVDVIDVAVREWLSWYMPIAFPLTSIHHVNM